MSLLKDIKMNFARLLMKFSEDCGLVYEGEVLEVGMQVFVESEGQFLPAPDGQYGPYTVKDGVVVEIADEPKEEPVEEPEVEETKEEVVVEAAEEVPADEPKEEPKEEPVEEPKDDTAERLTAAEEKIAELEQRLDEIAMKLSENTKALDEFSKTPKAASLEKTTSTLSIKEQMKNFYNEN